MRGGQGLEGRGDVGRPRRVQSLARGGVVPAVGSVTHASILTTTHENLFRYSCTVKVVSPPAREGFFAMPSVLDQRPAPAAAGPRPGLPWRRTRVLALPEARWALAALVLFLLALPLYLLGAPGWLWGRCSPPPTSPAAGSRVGRA